MTQMSLPRKQQPHRYRNQTLGYQWGPRVGEGTIGSLGLADAN